MDPLETIRKLMRDMPAKETWLSSVWFPRDSAWRLEATGENFLCANPSLWARLARECSPSAPSSFRPALSPLAGIQIIDIDARHADSAEAAKWRREHWRRLSDAMAIACVPLPDWLRKAPQFTEFQ